MNRQHIENYLKLVGSEIEEHQTREGWVQASCPLAKSRHSNGVDKHPSFGVREEPNGISRFHCFSCGSSGDLMDIIITAKQEFPYDLDKMQIDKALQMLSVEEDDHDLDKFVFESEVKKHTEDIYVFEDSYVNSFKSVTKFKEGVAYLHGRGVSTKVIKEMNIRYDSTHDRIVMPIRDWQGRYVGMHGRSIFGSFKNPYFMYRCDLRCNPIVWYGEHHIDVTRPVVLVESVFDMYKVYAQYKNVMCSLTSGIGRAKVERLKVINNLITIADAGKGGDFWKKAIDKGLPTHDIQHINFSLYDDNATDPGDMSSEAMTKLLESEFLI